MKTSEFFILLEGATNVENLNEGEQLDLKFLGNFLTFLNGTSDNLSQIIGCHADVMFIPNIKINFVIFEIVFISIETCLILFTKSDS